MDLFAALGGKDRRAASWALREFLFGQEGRAPGPNRAKRRPTRHTKRQRVRKIAHESRRRNRLRARR